MPLQFDEQYIRDYCKRTGTPLPDGMRPDGEAEKPKRSKYGNVRTERSGRVYDSAHEADIADELAIRLKAGEFVGLMYQVPFGLPGGVKYVADFVTLHAGGTYRVIDAKSAATRTNAVYRIKKRLMLECLGIEIDEV